MGSQEKDFATGDSVCSVLHKNSEMFLAKIVQLNIGYGVQASLPPLYIPVLCFSFFIPTTDIGTRQLRSYLHLTVLDFILIQL